MKKRLRKVKKSKSYTGVKRLGHPRKTNGGTATYTHSIALLPEIQKAKVYIFILAESGCRQSPIDVIDSETQQDSSLQPVEASFGQGEEYKLVLHIVYSLLLLDLY